MKKIILLVIILFSLTGCYNYRELNDLAIISGVSISLNDGLYKITTEVVNPKKEQDTSSGKEPDYIIYEGYGKSMQEAFRNIVKESPQKLYGAQIDILLIDEETATKGIDDILDFFARDPEVRSEFYVVISKSDEALKVISPLVNISSKNMVKSLESSNKYIGISSLVTYNEFMNNYLNPYREIALPSIEVIGDIETGSSTTNVESTTPNANNLIGNMAIFKDNKLVGYLDKSTSIGYNMIMNNSNTVLVTSSYKEKNDIVNEIISSSTEVSVNPKNMEVSIKVKGTASISEVNSDIKLESVEVIKKIEKLFNDDIEKILHQTITKVIDEYNTDIFGFNDLFYKEDPKIYKKMIKDNFLKELKFKIKSEVKIIEKGNLNGGINNG